MKKIFSKKMLRIIKKYYLQEKIPKNDIELIRGFFDMYEVGKYTVNDQCFFDLDMNSVFYKIDRSYSSPGEDVLYKMLREPVMDEQVLIKRNNVIETIKSNQELRAKIQYIFFDLGFDNKKRFLEMMKTEHKENKVKSIMYTSFGIFTLICLIMMIITLNTYWAFSIFILLLASIGISGQESKHVNVNGLIYLQKMLNSANGIISLEYAEDLGIENLKKLLDKLYSIRLNTRLLNIATSYGGVLEPLLVPFLIVEGSYYRVTSHLKDSKKELLELYNELGKLEAYVSIAIYQETLKDSISKPKFLAETKLEIHSGIHPLLSNPVKNSIIVNKKGVVLTGTNMSGKSTFLRMIGINVIFAQTFYFTISEKYEASFLNIVTSISPKDDINNGKSYYIAEVESILEILNSLKKPIPTLCIIDEIFKGTNPIERISSSVAILNYINKSNAITFVTTHDKELTDLLNKNYDFYYFSEVIDKSKGLSFDYKLKPGLIKSRNAIKLLSYMGYPEEIITEAITITKRLSRDFE